MIVRLAKTLLVLQIGLFSLLVGIDNIIDYGTNYAFVGHVLSMDTVFPNSTLKWRAINSVALDQVAYAMIIALELATGAMCIFGAFKLWQTRSANATVFNKAKGWAIVGLVSGISLWFFGFMTVGGEWFQMWQSSTWNGQEGAFRFIACIGLILIFLNQKDAEL